MATQQEIETIRTRLTEAETAYHDLMIGNKAVVVVDQNGERVEFQRAASSRLSAYIQMLRTQLAEATGGTANSGGPAFLWGSK